MDPVVCCAYADAKLAKINTAITHKQRVKNRFVEWTVSLFVFIKFVMKASPSLVALQNISLENHAET
jgi:hypothetical protein